MTADYFDAEKTGGSKNRLEITIDVKTDKVMDFALEIRDITIDKVLEIIEEAYFGAGQSEIDYHSRLIEGIGLLKGGDAE